MTGEKRKRNIMVATKVPEDVYAQLQEYLRKHPEYISISEVVRHIIVEKLKEEGTWAQK
jgi:hypothetical protein